MASGGRIELVSGENLDQALEGLDGFSHIWVLFHFDQAQQWKPKIMPPRGDRKVGCLASRSPHRPNPIGMSVLELISISGRVLELGHHDLVDGTSILDIKPYLPKVDAWPNATEGWVGECEHFPVCELTFSTLCDEQLQFLKQRGLDLLALAQVSLEMYPFPRKGRRNRELADGNYELACKTWRLRYSAVQERDGASNEDVVKVNLLGISSGYSREVLLGQEPSRWDDVPLHQAFVQVFGSSQD